jgi:hypothetical protein
VIAGVQVFVYPEELRATAPADLAEQIRGLDCDAVSMAIVYHRARRVFPRQRRIDVLTRTAFYLRPGNGYGALRPAPLDGLADDVLRFREACEDAALRFRAWVVALHDDRLAAEHPDAAAHVLDGGPLGHSLCPSSPEARAYVVALARDAATQLAPDAVELEAGLYPAWEPSYTLTLALQPLGEDERILATQCFCRWCRELIGDGADELEARARAGDAAVAAELAPVRSRGVGRLVGEAAEAVQAAGSELRVFAGGPPEQAAAQGLSAEAFAPADAILLGCGPLRGSELTARFALLNALVDRRPATASSNWTPERGPREWAYDVAALAAEGAEGLALYNLTLVPDEGVEAMRAAARAFRAA